MKIYRNRFNISKESESKPRLILVQINENRYCVAIQLAKGWNRFVSAKYFSIALDATKYYLSQLEHMNGSG